MCCLVCTTSGTDVPDSNLGPYATCCLVQIMAGIVAVPVIRAWVAAAKAADPGALGRLLAQQPVVITHVDVLVAAGGQTALCGRSRRSLEWPLQS